MSQSFPRARVVLNEIAKDPKRSMIVIDPVLTDTAKMSDFHLWVRPGTDAWFLAAMAAVLVQENLCDEAFLVEHVHGAEAVQDALRDVRCATTRCTAEWTRSCCGPRTGASAPSAVSRCSRTSACSRHPTARRSPT